MVDEKKEISTLCGKKYTELDPHTIAELENRMYYKAPDEDARRRHKLVQDGAFEFAKILMLACPNRSRERETAMDRIEEAKMWANAAIAHHQGE